MADLSHLARQALHRDGFVALSIAHYQLCHRLDDEAMAEFFECTLGDLNRLRLCVLPRTDHFQEDIERIAIHVHVKADKLTKVLSS